MQARRGLRTPRARRHELHRSVQRVPALEHHLGARAFGTEPTSDARDFAEVIGEPLPVVIRPLAYLRRGHGRRQITRPGQLVLDPFAGSGSIAAAAVRLGRRAAAHFSRADEGAALVYVPAAVVWENCLLARAGRLNLRR